MNEHAFRVICSKLCSIFGLILLGGFFILAEADHIDCGAVIGPGGTFVLDSNVGPCPDFGITILGRGGMNTTLDMNNFTVSCDDGDNEAQFGIGVVGNNVTVKNGIVTLCDTGFAVDGDNNKLTGNTSILNTNRGFLIFAGSNGNFLDSNLSTNNDGTGFFVEASKKNTLSNNTAINNGIEGFNIAAEGKSNMLLNNTAASNLGNGFKIENDKNILETNTANNNGGNGFHIIGNKNKLTENQSFSNAEMGFYFEGESNKAKMNSSTGNGDEGFHTTGNNNKLNENSSTGNGFVIMDGGNGFDIESSTGTFKKNSATGNFSHGFVISLGFTGNKIINNTASGNGDEDLLDENAECFSNTWRKNTFDTKDPECID